MNDKKFEKAIDLFDTIGKVQLRDGKDLRSALCLMQEISLWDVLASYLVLYRFPLMFLPDNFKPTWRDRVKLFIRPYRGLAGRLRESIIPFSSRNTIACKGWPDDTPTILFLGFMPTFYRDVLSTVAELLVKKSDVRVVVIGNNHTPVGNVSLNNRIKFQSLWEHWGNDVATTVKEMLRNLKVLQKNLFDEFQFKTLIQQMNDPFVSFSLHREFHWLFWCEFKRLIPQFAIAKHILEEHHPALIITADDADQRCRIYSLLAKKKGISSLLIQQGLTGRAYPEWVFFSNSKVASMGQTSRHDMIAQGIPGEKIIVTGHPGFDRLVITKSEIDNNLRLELNIVEGQKMLLFASQPYYVGVFKTAEIRRSMIQAIVDAVNYVENVKLIVKPHPGENVRELRKLVGKSQKVIVVDRTKKITDLIKICDLLITFSSTSALEALYIGKPVINVDFPESGGATLYEESGSTWIAHSVDEIITHIRNLTGGDRAKEIAQRESVRQRFLNDMVYLTDGRATERVTQTALNMLRHQ